MKNRTPMVAHFIAGYPTKEASIETARGLVEGGATYLEMQFPFSDPFADGPVIEEACRASLEQGCTVNNAFSLLSQLTEELKVPIFLMSYANLFFAAGMKSMVQRAKNAGAAGLIIPDLTYGRDEGLYHLGKQVGIDIVPVVTPAISKDRLGELVAQNPKWIYTALRSGITGNLTTLDETNLGLLKTLQPKPVKVMAGFGIQKPEQVATLAPYCNAVVVGSAIVRAVTKAYADAVGSSNRPGSVAVREVAKDTIQHLLG